MRRYVTVLAFAVLAFIGWSPSLNAQGAPVTVKLAEGSRNFNVLPIYIAMHHGYFAAEGIKPELITLKGGPAAANALVTGDVDIGITLTESVLKLRPQGKDLTVAAVIQDKNPCVIVVSPNSPAKSLADLKGQSIGVTAIGSLTDLILRAYIAEQGMSDSDFKIVGFGQPVTVNLALERGEIQAAVTITPFLTRMQLNKTGRVLVDFRDRLYPGQSMLVRSQDLTGPKKDVIAKVVRAVRKGMDVLYSDEAKTVEAAKAFFPQMDGDLLQAAIKDDTRNHAQFAAKLSVTPDQFAKWQDGLLKSKAISTAFPYEKVFASWN